MWASQMSLVIISSKVLRSACLYVSVFVYNLYLGLSTHIGTYLRNNIVKNKRNCLYTRYLWPWLGPPLRTLQRVMYYRFCVDDIMFSHVNRINQITLRLVEFAKWQNQGDCRVVVGLKQLVHLRLSSDVISYWCSYFLHKSITVRQATRMKARVAKLK